MKNLFEEDVEVRLKKAAIANLSLIMSSDRDSDELKKSKLREAEHRANLSGKELLDEYRARTESKFSMVETANRIMSFMNNNKVSEGDKRIFDIIINDPEILSKLIFITDGSYRTNRILYTREDFENMSVSALTMRNDYYPYEDSQYDDSIGVGLLMHMKENFESIFIQLVDDATALEEALEMCMLEDSIGGMDAF